MRVLERLSALRLRTLGLGHHDALLTITIQRPEVLNALSSEVIAELRTVIGALREQLGSGDDGPEDPDWSVRGVILTGAGDRSFVAGADISEMREMSRAESEAYSRDAQELTVWLETLPVPVVAAVGGYALGGGCELALACDVVLASENAVFGQPEVALGLIPGFGGCVRLQQFIGVAAARELILTGRRIDAAEALRLGLVTRVLPDREKLLAAAAETLGRAAGHSPVAVAAAKHAIRAAQSLPTERGLQLEREAFARCFDSADMREGTAAFVEKRTPRFSGR